MKGLERLLTQEEVSDHFRVNISTLWRWRRAGKIVALKTPGRRLRFRASDVAQVLEKERVPA